MKTIKFKEWHCLVHINRYHSGTPTISLVSGHGEPIATCTRNFPGQLKENQVALDINNCGHKLPQLLIDEGIIKSDIIQVIPNGFCDYPVYELTDEFKQQK